MGAWGSGPFDNDAALNYLGDLAGQFSVIDDDGGITPGTVDHARVKDALRLDMETTCTRPADSDDEREGGYAAAGLVAAVLAGVAVHSAGTRMREALAASGVGDVMEPLGLGAHCGYVALLTVEDAADLMPLARQAVAALAVDRKWLGSWLSDIRTPLATLEAVLT